MTRWEAVLFPIVMAIGLAVPASAVVGPMPVVDVSANASLNAQLAKAAAQLAQTLTLVAQGQAALATLQKFPNPTEIAATVTSVSGMLTQAQAQLTSGKCTNPTPASPCQIANQVASQQISGFAADIQALQNLQTLSRTGIGGETQAIQALNETLIAQSTTLQQLHQLEVAKGLQQQIDARALATAMHGTPAYNMWSPSP